MRKLSLAAALAFVYLLITGEGSITNCIVGFVVGAMVSSVSRFEGNREKKRRFLKRFITVPLFSWGVAQELAQGSWTMLQILLGQKSWKNEGFIEVPIGERSPIGALLSGLVATATPGSVLIEIDWPKGVMKLHVIDATDPDRIRAKLERFYQTFQKPMLP